MKLSALPPHMREIAAKPISFVAVGTPKGQPRAKAWFNKAVGSARVYDPGTADGWKAIVALAAKPHVPPSPLTGPVTVRLVFWMPRPKGHYRTGKRAHELRDNAPRWHTSKPDADNLAKAVLDVMANIGIWRDDTQVSRLIVEKVYSRTDKPGCLVNIEAMEDGGMGR